MDRTGRTRELIRIFPHMKPLVAPVHLDYAECRPTVLATGKEKDMRRARHQKGSLQRVKRKSGESVWIFRWYEVQLDGTKCYRKAVIGSGQRVQDRSRSTEGGRCAAIGDQRTNPATAVTGHQYRNPG